jgi:hypothetical protein
MKVVSKIGSGRFGESTGTIQRRGRKNSALWRMAHVAAVERVRGELRQPPIFAICPVKPGAFAGHWIPAWASSRFAAARS